MENFIMELDIVYRRNRDLEPVRCTRCNWGMYFMEMVSYVHHEPYCSLACIHAAEKERTTDE